jgi:hypothetical protein
MGRRLVFVGTGQKRIWPWKPTVGLSVTCLCPFSAAGFRHLIDLDVARDRASAVTRIRAAALDGSVLSKLWLGSLLSHPESGDGATGGLAGGNRAIGLDLTGDECTKINKGPCSSPLVAAQGPS